MVAPRSLSGLEQRQDGLAGGLVEVAGGLVGEDDGRLAGQGPGDGHPLPLSAGELRGPGRRPRTEADEVEGIHGPPPPLGLTNPGVEQSVGHVVQNGLVLGQEELLEDEPDPGGPQRRRPRRRPSVATSSPVTRTVPEVGRSRVPMRWSSVVLPEPEGPTMPTSSPGPTLKLTPRSAWTGGWLG